MGCFCQGAARILFPAIGMRIGREQFWESSAIPKKLRFFSRCAINLERSAMDLAFANIFLIGYRGTGKSTVARLLAERLGWKAVDADAILETRAGRTIQQIFADDGEAYFRDLES